jgi:hypothetical protein
MPQTLSLDYQGLPYTFDWNKDTAPTTEDLQGLAKYIDALPSHKAYLQQKAYVSATPQTPKGVNDSGAPGAFSSTFQSMGAPTRLQRNNAAAASDLGIDLNEARKYGVSGAKALAQARQNPVAGMQSFNPTGYGYATATNPPSDLDSALNTTSRQALATQPVSQTAKQAMAQVLPHGLSREVNAAYLGVPTQDAPNSFIPTLLDVIGSKMGQGDHAFSDYAQSPGFLPALASGLTSFAEPDALLTMGLTPHVPELGHTLPLLPFALPVAQEAIERARSGDYGGALGSALAFAAPFATNHAAREIGTMRGTRDAIGQMPLDLTPPSDVFNALLPTEHYIPPFRLPSEPIDGQLRLPPGRLKLTAPRTDFQMPGYVPPDLRPDFNLTNTADIPHRVSAYQDYLNPPYQLPTEPIEGQPLLPAPLLKITPPRTDFTMVDAPYDSPTPDMLRDGVQKAHDAFTSALSTNKPTSTVVKLAYNTLRDVAGQSGLDIPEVPASGRKAFYDQQRVAVENYLRPAEPVVKNPVVAPVAQPAKEVNPSGQVNEVGGRGTVPSPVEQTLERGSVQPERGSSVYRNEEVRQGQNGVNGERGANAPKEVVPAPVQEPSRQLAVRDHVLYDGKIWQVDSTRWSPNIDIRNPETNEFKRVQVSDVQPLDYQPSPHIHEDDRLTQDLANRQWAYEEVLKGAKGDKSAHQWVKANDPQAVQLNENLRSTRNAYEEAIAARDALKRRTKAYDTADANAQRLAVAYQDAIDAFSSHISTKLNEAKQGRENYYAKLSQDREALKQSDASRLNEAIAKIRNPITLSPDAKSNNTSNHSVEPSAPIIESHSPIMADNAKELRLQDSQTRLELNPREREVLGAIKDSQGKTYNERHNISLALNESHPQELTSLYNKGYIGKDHFFWNEYNTPYGDVKREYYITKGKTEREVIPATTAERQQVIGAMEKEKVQSNGLTKSQEAYLVQKLQDVVKEFKANPGEPAKVIPVPGDGTFTVSSAEQAAKLMDLKAETPTRTLQNRGIDGQKTPKSSFLADQPKAELVSSEVEHSLPLNAKTPRNTPAPSAPQAPVSTPKTPVEVKKTLSAFKGAQDWFNRTFAPMNIDKSARQTGGVLRNLVGERSTRYEQAVEATKQAREHFAKNSNQDNVDIITGFQKGQKNPDTLTQRYMESLAEGVSKKAQQFEALTGRKIETIENYFAQIWKEGEDGQPLYTGDGRKSIKAGTPFTKQRTFADIQEGIDAGFTPVSYNPADLALAKMREIDRAITGIEAWNELKASKLLKWKYGANTAPPEGMERISDPAAEIFGSQTANMKEFYDAGRAEAIQELLDRLGISHERKPMNTAGTAQGTHIQTAAGSEMIQAVHELGHAVNNIYPEFGEGLLKNKATANELRKLAGLRTQGNSSTREYNAYIKGDGELIANLFAAINQMPDEAQRLAPKSIAKLNEFIAAHPELEGIDALQPSLVVKERNYTVDTGNIMKMGEWYAPHGAATVINNYLSPGFRGDPVFDSVNYIGNNMNMAQLAFPLYHVGTTMFNAGMNDVALGLEKAINTGNIVGGVKSVAKGLTILPSLVDQTRKGGAVYKAFLKGNSEAPVFQDLLNNSDGMQKIFGQAPGTDMVAVLNGITAAGGKVRPDSLYTTQAVDHFKEALKDQNLPKAVLHALPAVFEKAAAPVMQYLVPRVKLGAFSELLTQRLAEVPNDHQLSTDEFRQMAQETWDSIDNRLGQLVYDNLMVNKRLVDTSHVLVRSVGWTLGTLREVGGGIADAAATKRRMQSGEKVLTSRMAYSIAMPVVTAAIGTLLHTLMTGQQPQDTEDMFYPRTGRTLPNGKPERLQLATYAKEVRNFRDNPLKWLEDKGSPLVHEASDLWNNVDYRNNQVRDTSKDALGQAVDVSKYLLKTNTPIAAQQFFQDSGAYGKTNAIGDALIKYGGGIGAAHAPVGLDQTAAERKAYQIQKEFYPQGAKNELQQQQLQAKKNIREASDKGAQASQEVRAGNLSPKQALNAEMPSTGLEGMIKHFNALQALQVYKEANTQEQSQIKGLVMKKILSDMKNGSANQQSAIKAAMKGANFGR